MSRFSYFRRSLAARFVKSRLSCPNCGCSKAHRMDRKYLVTELRRCDNCSLMFRIPTDDPSANEAFYENEYEQGFTTDIPSEAELHELMRSGFSGTEKDYTYYINVLKEMGLSHGARVFDFGCSWGYGSFQFGRAGFDVTAFEVAPSRRRFANEKLSVNTIDDMEHAAREMAASFDCFFSAHVIEHVPSPAKAFDYALRLLKPNGIFVSFTPNGSKEHRIASPQWSKLWGQVHPNFIDDVFLDKSFNKSPRGMGSTPVSAVSMPDNPVLNRLNDLQGGELLFIARKAAQTWG
jgi:SAM-dependent methyltransferase